jgi:hypothetical protein
MGVFSFLGSEERKRGMERKGERGRNKRKNSSLQKEIHGLMEAEPDG